MMTYFPMPYEDELFYSLLSRCYSQGGYLNYREAIQDIYYSKSNNPSIEFIGHLSPQMNALVRQIFDMEQLVISHTMFPQYSRFIPLEKRKIALYRLCNDFGDAHHLFPILPRSDTDLYLKYCPLCAKENRNRFGETYWHREHQLRNMTVCVKHGYHLESSSVLAVSEKTFAFSSAEENATITTPRYTTNPRLVDYSRYIAEVFHSTIDMKKHIPISTVFYYALQGTKYMPRSTKARHTQLLSHDLKAFYESIGINDIVSIYQIQRLLLGYRFDFSAAVQVAYFLGISAKDLTQPCFSDEEIEREQEAHYIRNRAPTNWRELDKEMAPRMERLAHDTYYGIHARPQRVSERLVIRELGFNSHTLENLPKCRAILEKYAESYEESWARRIIWAYERLDTERNGKPFYSTDLRKLSGVKMKNISKVIPYISKHTAPITAKKILSLVNKSDFT